MSLPVVFLGPTLERPAAAAVLTADYRPPAGRGDVLRALDAGPPAIGLVDGVFHAVPPVWHKEILLALETGVAVYGAASMGALRAAELERFGMVPVGAVAAAYCAGRLDADDAVAVLHEPAERGFRRLTEALVDVLDLHAAALDAGVVDAAQAATLGAVARGLHYSERDRPALRRGALAAGVGASVLDRLDAFAAGRRPVKARDALALCARMAADAGRPPTAAAPVPVERTVALLGLAEEVETELHPWGRVIL